MPAASTHDNRFKDATQKRSRGLKRMFYVSKHIAASAAGTGRVTVDFSIGADPGDLVLLRNALAAAAPTTVVEAEDAKSTGGAAKLLKAIFERAAERYLGDAFTKEFETLISEYRVMLRENLVKGDDAQLKAALNRARLQERILASTEMVDQGQACVLLGLSGANPSATMKRKEDKHELLRFTVDGRAAYPLVQFDVESRRIYPAVSNLLAKKPDHWSDFRLLHWLTKPHLDFEDTPGAALATEPEAVIASFEREIEPEVHG